MPFRVCLESGCPELIPQSRRRCPTHAAAYERTIARAEPGKYGGRRWRIARRAYLTDHPICERCNVRLADHVHHRTELRDGGPMYQQANMESLCRSCHSKETRRRQLTGLEGDNHHAPSSRSPSSVL